MITVRSATSADVAILRHWDTQPHVREAGIEGWAWEEEIGTELGWREQLIAELDGLPLGFLQIIDPRTDAAPYWHTFLASPVAQALPNRLRAIDIWIGMPDQLGKGYGTRMMHWSLRRCLKHHQAQAVLIDPLRTNTRAHRFYQRLGFELISHWQFDDDMCAVFQLEINNGQT